VMWRAAAHEAAAADALVRIEGLLGLNDAQALRYVDGKRGLRRTIALDGAGDAMRVRAFLLAGQTEAEPWLRALLVDEQPAQAYGRGLLRAGAAPPGALPVRSPQVCTCHDVGEARIRDVLRTLPGSADARLAQLQQRLRCGTSCGSCLPALRRAVVDVQPAGPAVVPIAG
jgi:assimilatory nitrate reductase catalytic subunit